MNLIICDIPWYSGLSYYAISVAKILREKGDILWATEPETPLHNKLKEEGIKLIPIKSRRTVNQIKNYKIILNSLKEPPGNILAFTGSSFFLGYLLKKRFKSRLIRFRTESYSVKSNIFNKFLYGKADIVVAGSDKIRVSLEKIGINNIKVIPLGIDASNIKVKEIKNNKTVGFLGRLDRIKGIDILWKTMNILWNREPEIKLLIAGKEEFYRWKDIKDNFKGRVEYLGFIPEEEKENFFQRSMFGIISSKGSEATSRVLLEWWANGRTVVATDVGILEELIDERKNGIIVKRDNPEELARGILYLMNNFRELKDMSIRGREKVEKELSAEIFKKKILEIIS